MADVDLIGIGTDACNGCLAVRVDVQRARQREYGEHTRDALQLSRVHTGCDSDFWRRTRLHPRRGRC
jgi:uncharacterized membrane protein